MSLATTNWTRAAFWHTSRRRFRPSRINALALARYDARSPEQLLALLTEHLHPRGLPAALDGRVALTERLIHHQDIRRALGLPRAIPPERLLPALRCTLIAPDIGGLWRIRGLRLVATDLGFSAGAGAEVRGAEVRGAEVRGAEVRGAEVRGAEVRGAAEALLMGMAGRRAVMGELSGPGRTKLAGRIGR